MPAEEAEDRMPEMDVVLARIPRKKYLTTQDVCKVFDRHIITIYRWCAKGILKRYRVRSKGNANIFKRKDIIEAVRRMYSPDPID